MATTCFCCYFSPCAWLWWSVASAWPLTSSTDPGYCAPWSSGVCYRLQSSPTPLLHLLFLCLINWMTKKKKKKLTCCRLSKLTLLPWRLISRSRRPRKCSCASLTCTQSPVALIVPGTSVSSLSRRHTRSSPPATSKNNSTRYFNYHKLSACSIGPVGGSYLWRPGLLPLSQCDHLHLSLPPLCPSEVGPEGPVTLSWEGKTFQHLPLAAASAKAVHNTYKQYCSNLYRKPTKLQNTYIYPSAKSLVYSFLLKHFWTEGANTWLGVLQLNWD